jgi:hypothetical protein
MQKRGSASKNILAVWLGDPHCGPAHGLTAPKLAQSERQRWLADTFQHLTKRILTEAKGRALHLHLGGDMVHLPGDDDARELAESLFAPLVKASDQCYAVAGTEYHSGTDGGDDRSIYRGLGIPAANIRVGTAYLEIGGRLAWWAHHGPKVGRRPHTTLNPFHAVAEDVYWRCLEGGERRPDILIGHHVHHSPEPVYNRRIWVATCPALALPDAFAAKVGAFDKPSIGALVYYPDTNGLDLWTYDIPRRHLFA